MTTKILSVITQKGGVGKTTSTIHIGGCLAEKGYKVLLIDFDTQMNLSQGYNVEDFSYNVEDFLEGKISPKFTQKGIGNNVYIISGSSTIREKKYNKYTLKKAIEGLKGNFDFVLIDCPPKPIVDDDLTLGEIAVNASDYVISPIKADKFSLIGIETLLNAINKLKITGLKANVLGFFFNEVEQQTNHFKEYYSALNESSANNFLIKEFIRKDVNIKNAMEEGKTIFEVRPYGRASQDFRKLTDEILNKIEEYEQEN